MIKIYDNIEYIIPTKKDENFMKKGIPFFLIPAGIFVFMIITAFCISYFGFDFRFSQNNNVISSKNSTISNNTITIPPDNPSVSGAVNLNVPFTSQAPGGDWNGPFEHTCEEASVLMIQHYLTGEKFTSIQETRQELLNLVNFENKKYGFSDITDAAQTARFIRDYYGYNAQVFYDITLDDMKKELSEGNPVIVPTAGRLLGNPNYTDPGPLYHMLVIKGYTNSEFITNDAGTRNGAEYKYSYAVIQNALSDFYTGRSAMIVITLN